MAASALKDKGWFLTDEGIEQCSQTKKDVESIIKTALDTDLKEIGKPWLPEDVNRGKADYVEGPGVLQVQKIRNVSAPKDHEESQAAPRLMKLVLTDGHITCTAIETETLNNIGSKTAPGSKIKLKMTADVEHGFLLLNNKNTQYLGGRVDKLAEGWELKKKLAKQERTFGTDGGPPPFVPFGQRIDGNIGKGPPRRDNFKSLEVSKGEKKPEKKAEDAEFEQQRKATIAEALQAKEDAQTKKFGGGQNKLASDEDVARIVSMGFPTEAANSALRANNGNLQQAIDYLLADRSGGPMGRGRNGPIDDGRRVKGDNLRQADDGRGRGRRNRRDDDGGPGGRRGRDQEDGGDTANSKPSGPATLFDFLETKIPANENKGKSSKSQDYVKNESNRRTYNNRDPDPPLISSSTDTTANKDFNRPKSQPGPGNTVPPRFANKSKPDNIQGYNRNKGQSYEDRSLRDNVPKSAPVEGWNNNTKSYENRTSFNDRNDRNRNNSNRNNDQDVKGQRDMGRQNSRSSDYSEKNGDESNSKGNKQPSKQKEQGSKYGNRTQNREEFNNDAQSGQPRENDQYNTQQRQSNDGRRDGANSARGDQKSRYNKNTEEKVSPVENVAPQGSRTKQPQQTYKQENRDRGYGVNGGNHGNHRPPSQYGNNQPMAGQYQQQPDFRYSEVPQVPGFKRGDRVLAKYWEDGQFYPARINELYSNLPTCMVTFESYDNSEEVYLSDIRPIIGAHMMGQPDFSVPPPQIFYAPGPPQPMVPGIEECIQGINSIEFRRGGGGARYQKKDQSRPPQQLYQPPSQRR